MKKIINKTFFYSKKKGKRICISLNEREILFLIRHGEFVVKERKSKINFAVDGLHELISGKIVLKEEKKNSPSFFLYSRFIVIMSLKACFTTITETLLSIKPSFILFMSHFRSLPSPN